MNLALFDFDGTITTGDTWTPFMRRAVRPVRLLAWIPFMPFVAAERLGLVPASRVRQLAARVGFYGDDAERVRALGRDYAATFVRRRLRRSALQRIEWHKTQGDAIVVVSASLDVYLEPWCRSQSVDCICTTLEERGGRLTGRYVSGDCTGAEKARRIRERLDLESYSHIYAYGDTEEDREMLALAGTKWYQWTDMSAEVNR